jgi:cysteine desulfurase
MKRIYLDNAATTPVDQKVFESMIPFFMENFGNPSSTYAEGRTSRAAVEKSRRNIAKLINASAPEIFFTSGGTEANNTAIKGSVKKLGVQRIISSQIEHACVKNSAMTMMNEGIKVDYVKLDNFGRADLVHLESLLKENNLKTLVSLMHSNNEIGTLNDLAAIANLCSNHNALFHTDTVQTFGYYNIDVNAISIDFLSGSAHKLHGPKGIGFLYVNKKNHLPALIDGGGQERALRSGTENVTGIVGFGKASELLLENRSEFEQQIKELKYYFKDKLMETFREKVSFNGDVDGNSHFKVLSVNFDSSIAQDMLLFKLDLAGISVSGGSACSSGSTKGSSVIAAIGVPSHLKTIRFSFSHNNTIEELDHTIKILKTIIS